MIKSPLTWDAVLEVVRRGSPSGLTNTQIKELIGAHSVNRVTHLTLIMFEAGVLNRRGPLDPVKQPIRYFVSPGVRI